MGQGSCWSGHRRNHFLDLDVDTMGLLRQGLSIHTREELLVMKKLGRVGTHTPHHASRRCVTSIMIIRAFAFYEVSNIVPITNRINIIAASCGRALRRSF